eukprot:scaffold1034_cov418-Prasinococcus_capsulatus_cf.AAC.42
MSDRAATMAAEGGPYLDEGHHLLEGRAHAAPHCIGRAHSPIIARTRRHGLVGTAPQCTSARLWRCHALNVPPLQNEREDCQGCYVAHHQESFIEVVPSTSNTIAKTKSTQATAPGTPGVGAWEAAACKAAWGGCARRAGADLEAARVLARPPLRSAQA